MRPAAQNRQPEGIPVGGEFAATSHTEASVFLTPADMTGSASRSKSTNIEGQISPMTEPANPEQHESTDPKGTETAAKPKNSAWAWLREMADLHRQYRQAVRDEKRSTEELIRWRRENAE